jgi:Sulfatase-modifying factor enzyme 1
VAAHRLGRNGGSSGRFVGDCSNIIRWLANAQPEVAAQCILESGAEIANQPALLRELQSAWLPRLTSLEREPAPESRAAIGRALGRLGLDNRKGTGLRPDGLPDIDWVEILGGEFLYGEGERRRIETFRMARYPVTNAQFQAFLDARDGYAGDSLPSGRLKRRMGTYLNATLFSAGLSGHAGSAQ